ncbi:transporter [Putridiphycobacter roseus]|uniref:Transporter n=1 Tax=Putridiphycobacter roseus TaxID=2219161 RepID=A0A2W1MX63_9FLAO|nr:polyphosphate polymerase domain-containing protein [Putridiphycobacter roseus]PZE16729.1 transporter [Putridiphycobacter roseus]
MQLSEVNRILATFHPVSLAEMDEVKLMNRTDTKFVFPVALLIPLLAKLKEGYKVLSIKENRISTYKTLYFDTVDFDYYLDHHRGMPNRYKVRIRNYVESEIYFLEIKNKFKGRTDKKRISLPGFEEEFSATSKNFVDLVIENAPKLEAKLWNDFARITLVNAAEKERLTLDLNLGFSWKDKSVNFEHLVIGELKQENVNRNSLFYQLMKSNGFPSNSISKYCVGAVSLNPDIKYNGFKDKLLLIEKLKNYVE